MITGMKKLYMVVHKGAQDGFMNALQDRGAVHLVHEEIKNEDISDLVRLKNRLNNFLKSAPESSKSEKYSGVVTEILDKFEELMLKREELKSRLLKSEKDFSHLAPWGKRESILIFIKFPQRNFRSLISKIFILK